MLERISKGIKWLVVSMGCLHFIVITVVLSVILIGIATNDYSDMKRPSSVSTALANIDLSKTRLTEGVLKWKERILQEMQKQGVPDEYLPLVLGIVQVESGGGGVADIFQSSESQGLAPNTLSTEASIVAGISHFKNTMEKTNQYGKSIWALPAGYNFGHAFLDYLNRTNQDWTIKVAEEYSATVVAPSLGNTTREKLPYVNEVSKSYGIDYMYLNGGNFHYVPMLMWYLGYSLEEIKTIALNGDGKLISSPSGTNSSGSYTYFGDSLVVGTGEKFKETFPNSNVDGTVSLFLHHPSNPPLDGMKKFKELLDKGEVKQDVVFQLGTNGGFSTTDLEAFIKQAGSRKLYFITTASDVDFADDVATKLHEASKKYDNVKVIDWLAHVKGSNRFDYYGSDRVHFNEKGTTELMSFLKKELGKYSNNQGKNKRYLFNKFLNPNRRKKDYGNNLVEIAKSQIGLPYSWGGGGKEGPSTGIYDPAVQDATNIVGFDCSGFMQFIYWQAYKVDIGDWTVPQETSGKKVPKDELEVGDLLFWGSDGATYHVAMYIGNDELIESSRPGNPIGIHPMRDYSFAVRPDISKGEKQ